MKIKDYFKKIFLKEKNIELVNLKDIIPIPKRSDFESKDAIRQIDLYKLEYLDVLKENKYVINFDMHTSILFKKMNMAVELLLNIGFKEVTDVDTLPLEDKVNYLILIAKLDLYKDEVIELERETKLRLVSLIELIPHTRKRHLASMQNAIDNLYRTLMVYASVQEFINKKIRIYENETILNTIRYSLSEEENKRLERKIISKKVAELKPFEKDIDENTSRVDVIKKIAESEKELEEYAYKERGSIPSLLKEIKSINENINGFNKDSLLNIISDIERKFMIFSKYGRNVIREEDFTYLYEVKFNILTQGGIIEPFITDKTNEVEVKCYENIISKKIEKILKGENQNITNLFENDSLDVIKLISKIFKSNDIYDYVGILKDKYLLNFLLAFDTLGGLEYFFNNYYLSALREEVDLDVSFQKLQRYFTFTKEIPISLYCWFMSITKKSDMGRLNEKFSLYPLLMKHKSCVFKSGECYYFPEGLVSILNYTNESDIDYRILKREIEESIQGKIVIMPSSLKNLENPLFKDIDLKGLVLNEGLTSCSNRSLNFRNVEFIVIPSTLESIDAFRVKNLDTLIINNIDDAKIVDNELMFRMVLERHYISEVKGVKIKPILLYQDDEYIDKIDGSDFSYDYTTSYNPSFGFNYFDDNTKVTKGVIKLIKDKININKLSK